MVTLRSAERGQPQSDASRAGTTPAVGLGACRWAAD